MNLADRQRAMQAAILSGEAPQGLFRGDARADEATRFRAYADAYRLRLASFLSEEYPALREAMGDEAFGALVEAYVEAGPSRVRDARLYGARLPETLAERGAPPLLVDLARFERALDAAFHAADAEPMARSALADIPAQYWPALRFSLHPSVSCETYAPGVETLYAAARGENGEAETTADDVREDDAILIWRDDEDVRFERVDAALALFVRLAATGAGFGDICAALAFRDQDDAPAQAARALALCLERGLIARWDVQGP